MKTLRRLRDVVALQQFGMILTKVVYQAQIASALEKTGYNSTILEQGNDFLGKARERYTENDRNKDRYSYIQATFLKKKKEIDHIYRDHRRKAKLICINDQKLEHKLAIKGRYPEKYPLWLETVRKFYRIADRETRVQNKFLSIGITSEEIKMGLSNIAQLESLLAKKMRLKGDLRLSTAEKNRAFNDLHKWMRIFFAAAKLALKKEPELLEALGRHLS